MKTDLKIDDLIKDFESLLRYIAPGFTFIMIASLIDPCVVKYFDEVWVWLIIPFVGISWYAFHRSLLNLVDYLIYWFLGAYVQETIIANMANDSTKNRKYLYTRLANSHLTMMLGQQIITLNCVMNKGLCEIIILGIIIGGIGLASYWVTLREIITYDRGPKRENRDSDRLRGSNKKRK